MKPNELIYFFILSLYTLGCLPSSSGSGEDLFVIPAMSIDCKPEQSLDCNSSSDNLNRTFYIGLTSSSNIECREYILQIPTGQFATYFDANGFSTTSFTGVTEGTINSWRDENGFPTAHLAKKDHVICAYIDKNANERLDFDETVGQGLLSPSDSSPLIKDWF